jgi:hypothetical protein
MSRSDKTLKIIDRNQNYKSTSWNWWRRIVDVETLKGILKSDVIEDFFCFTKLGMVNLILNYGRIYKMQRKFHKQSIQTNRK